MVAPSEGIYSNFHEAFTQLHIGQLVAIPKCIIGNRRDGGINPKTDHIIRNFSSSSTSVDDDIIHDVISIKEKRKAGTSSRICMVVSQKISSHK
jgi:hypothetical protein